MNDTKTIIDYGDAGGIDPVQDQLLIWQFNTNSYKKINRDTLMGVTGSPLDTTSPQSVSNKTFQESNTYYALDDSFTLFNNADDTKIAQFDLSAISTATTRTYTLPNASSTLADISTAQTFTNKTLTSPVITGGSITNSSLFVDTVAEFTAANGVTVDGLNIKDGKLNTNNSVVTANYTDGSVTPAKLVSGTGSSWTWQTWSPSYTNLTVGNGTVNVARYSQIGKVVFVEYRLTFGNTTSITGSVSFSLPVTAASGYPNTFTSAIGNANYDDTGSNLYTGFVLLASTTVLSLRTNTVSGSNVVSANLSASVPFTFGTGDVIGFSAFYEAS